jgi:hypothetical protein
MAPAAKNPALAGLQVLVGDWAVQVPQDPDLRGKVAFAWLEDGAFLAQRADFGGGIWHMWREEPGFWQRFVGTLGQGGGTISGRWEKSSDGVNWQHDFDINYSRLT